MVVTVVYKNADSALKELKLAQKDVYLLKNFTVLTSCI